MKKRSDTHLDESTLLPEDGFTPVEDEDAAPADENMPRRAALGIVGGLAGLAALAASSNSASAHTADAGRIMRIRQVIDSVRVPNNSNRVLRLVCPDAPSGQRVFVLGGGYNLAGPNANNPGFVVKTSAPDTLRSWLVDGHSTDGTGYVDLGGYAICAYLHT